MARPKKRPAKSSGRNVKVLVEVRVTTPQNVRAPEESRSVFIQNEADAAINRLRRPIPQRTIVARKRRA